VLTIGADDKPTLDEMGLSVEAKANNKGEALTMTLPWSAVWAIESNNEGGRAFFAEACPPEEVARIFTLGMELSGRIRVLEGAVSQAFRIVDTGAPRGAWLSWRKMTTAMLAR
jgi:hypothetical protein